MRVSNQMMNHMLSSSIQENQSAVYKQEGQIASGQKVSRASDDPVAWAQIAGLKQQKNELQGYMKATDTASSNLLALDHSLSTLSDIMLSASETAIHGADPTLDAEDRKVLSRQVDQLLEELVAVSNSTYDGQYQFSGVQTQTEPFTVTRNVAGDIDSVSYNGAAFSSSVQVAPGDSVPQQLVGSGADNGMLISTEGNAFDALIALRDELVAGTDIGMSGLQTEIESVRTNVVLGRATVGAYIEHTSFVRDIHAAKEQRLSTSISSLEDIDVAEAVTELSAKQTAYEASLSMASKTLSLSLLKYL